MIIRDVNDWRLLDEEEYMSGIKIKKILPCKRKNVGRDGEFWHEHCEFCMDKVDRTTKEAWYCTMDEYRFVCPTCFEDFKKMFKWELVDDTKDTELKTNQT